MGNASQLGGQHLISLIRTFLGLLVSASKKSNTFPHFLSIGVNNAAVVLLSTRSFSLP